MDRRLLALSLSFIALACAVEDADDGEFRIINGEPAPATVPAYAATVGLHFKIAGPHFSATPSCSATLIASDVVLTAGHCLAKQSGNSISAISPSDVRVFFGDSAGSGGVLATVSETLVHPQYNPFSLVNDIAILRLSQPAPVAPIPNLPASLGFDGGDVGTVLDFVGFGYSDLAKTDYGVKLHNTIPLGALGCPQAVYPACPAGAPTTTQFSYSQSDAGEVEGPCNGDSGGPAFVTLGGTTYVAGVTSYGDGPCDDYGVSTNVAAFEGWIAEFVGAGGGDDGGGDGGGGCGDDTCDDGESCDGRNGTTSCIADCPGKTGGKPSTRFCTVGSSCEGPACP
jgi:secreted trypsin-like serine protease